jgi:natural product biosynthesis luciferase-like monooxygenase protein
MMDFSIMFWGNGDHCHLSDNKYELLLEASKYVDQAGFKAIWIPERHFHPWGGLFPNPSVICAALATITKQIRLRAGSVVAPLHHPLRIAEEWSVVDNLSGGRVEIAMASGWKDDDFVLRPETYAKRKSALEKTINIVSSLWEGKQHEFVNGSDSPIQVEIYPKPVQQELPLWVTSAGSLKSITRAGLGGFGLLTHLLGQTFETLEEKVSQYTAYRLNGGFTNPGKISLMLHTFIGEDASEVRKVVQKPLCDYLEQSTELALPQDLQEKWHSSGRELKDEMINQTFNRYFETSALMGTPEHCGSIIEKLHQIGVTDVCCLIDFGLPIEQVMGSLELLTKLKNQYKDL